jgi:hypothetical protein
MTTPQASPATQAARTPRISTDRRRPESSNTARTRQRLLSLVLPAAALLYFGATALNPKGTDQLIDNRGVAAKVLPIAAAHTSQLYLSGAFTVFAVGAIGLAYAAIATLVRGRGAALATTAAIFGGLTNFCGAILNVLVGFNVAAAASAHIGEPAAGTFLVTTFTSRFAQSLSAAYIAGIVLAPILMGVALWRSRNVPRWLAVLFVASLELAQQIPSKGPVVAGICVAPFAVATVALAIHMWRPERTAGNPTDPVAALA